MAVLNKVQLIGRIGHSPRNIKPKDYHIASASLATNESFRCNGKWEAVTEWHNLIFFGKLADDAIERLDKGSHVYVEGKLRSSYWTDSEGIKKKSINIVVQTMQLLDNSKPKALAEEDDRLTAEDYLAQMHSMVEQEDSSE